MIGKLLWLSALVSLRAYEPFQFNSVCGRLSPKQQRHTQRRSGGVGTALAAHSAIVEKYCLRGNASSDDFEACLTEVAARKEGQGEDEEDEIERDFLTSTRAFVFDSPREADSSITCRQTPHSLGKLGSSIWSSSIGLSLWLANQQSSLVQGKVVLELGAGCGLPGMTCAKIGGAARVILTDYWQEEVDQRLLDKSEKRLIPMHLFKDNLIFNARRNAMGGGKVDVEMLDWHERGSATDIVERCGGKIDVLIGSDLCYYPSDLLPLLSTLKEFSELGGDGAPSTMVFFFPLPPTATRESLDEFRQRIEGGFISNYDVESEEMDLHLQSFRHEGLLRLVLRK